MSLSEQFFADLAARGHDPRLHQAKGTVQFELAHKDRTDRCLVQMAHGDVTVLPGGSSEGDVAATCVVRCASPLFDEIVTGRANALAALLRGELNAEGDLQLLYHFQRVLPGPPYAVHPRDQQRARRRAS